MRHAVRQLVVGGAAILHQVWPELLTVGLVLLAGIVAWRWWQARRLTKGARCVTILAPPTVEPAGAQALWANLHGLIRPAWRVRLAGQPHLAFELVWTPRRVHVQMWVPGTVPPELVESAVAAAWPGAQTQTDPPKPPLPLDAGLAVGGELRLAQPEWFPLSLDQHADPLRAVFGAVGSLREGESACVQVLTRPVGARRLARSRRAARALRTGQSPTRIGRLLDLLTPGPTGSRRTTDDPTIAPDVRMILAKAAGQGWEAVVRYGVSSPVRGPATRRQLRGRAHALAAAYAALDGRSRLQRHRLRQPARVLAARRLRRGDLLSVAELAALAHLPTDAAVPGLVRAAARTVAPVPWVRSIGKVLGDADAGPPRPVALTAADARHHLHVVGATGTGKSTLIVNMVLDDVTERRGVVVVDPSGDLVNDLLDRLPAEVGERLVLLDPTEDQAPPILNMLDGPDPDLAVDHVVGIFSRIYGSYWGPRTDDILRACCLTLLRQPRGEVTLAHVPRLLGDAEFRRPYVEAVSADAGLEGFWSWYEQLTGWARAQAVGPVLNKLRAFFLRPFVNRVVAGGASSFDLDGLLDGGGVLLARVPKGLLGEETSRLLGSFVLSKVWQAATHRARVGEPTRRDTCAYADEAHNFLNLPIRFDEALAEARKYRLSLCLAHQYLGQLPRELREAISANARNKLIFNVSPEDAAALERHVAPELSAHDLANLGAWQAAARLVVGGAEQPACTLLTRPAAPVVPGRASVLRAQTRQRFGRTEQQRRDQGVRQQVGADEAAARQDPGSAADTGLSAPPTFANRRHAQ